MELSDPLDRRLPAAPDLDCDHHAHRISQLADRGDYAEAARQSTALLADDVTDIRLIGYHLFGQFLDRGVAWLPALLDRVCGLLSDDYAALGPRRKKQHAIDASLLWLFKTIDDRARYHLAQRDDTWTTWKAAEPSIVADIERAADAVTERIVAITTEPRSTEALSRLVRWVGRDLARALRTNVRQPDDGDEDELVADELVADERWPDTAPNHARSDEAREPAPARAPDAIDTPSPALAALIRKLDAFAVLVERGDMPKAAVVGLDIRRTIESFDPVVYLPKLFAGYFKLLHENVEQLMMHWELSDSPSWTALEHYYRADLDGFLND